MTQLVAKYAMKKVMAKEMDKYKSKDASGPYVSTTDSHHMTIADLRTGSVL
jgi:hypothetical protein